jgi:hypothetical protein
VTHIPAGHEPLVVNDDTFEKAQEILKRPGEDHARGAATRPTSSSRCLCDATSAGRDQNLLPPRMH